MFSRTGAACARRSFAWVLAFAVLGAGALLFSSVAHAQARDPLRVVVSINPYQDLVARVAGERATVSTILPAGASPHAFDPTPSQAAALARADLVVMNGGLDDWLVRLVQAAAPDAQVLKVMERVEFAPLAGHDHEDGDEHAGHEQGTEGPGGVNSHIWLDPRLMLQAVDAIAAALTQLDPAGADEYAANAATTQQELHALDEDLKELLAPVAGEPFVPFHDAWVYFASRYGLYLVTTLEPFPGREPSPRYVAEAVRDVVSSGARVIFSERQLGSRSAEVVAESAGVRVAQLDPLGGEPGPTTYEALLLENAAIILEALGH